MGCCWLLVNYLFVLYAYVFKQSAIVALAGVLEFTFSLFSIAKHINKRILPYYTKIGSQSLTLASVVVEGIWFHSS